MNNNNPLPEDATKSIRVPRRPHMPTDAAAFLSELLSQSTCYLEYGAGGSTRLAAILSVPVIYSVESDEIFAKAVRRYVSNDARGKNLSISVKTSKIGDTNQWGYPTDLRGVKQWPEYPLQVWDRMAKANVSPDLILIDGRFRTACLMASLLQSRVGTPILFDDYVGREARYGRIAAIIQPERLIDRMAVFRVPEQLNPGPVAALLARACLDKW